METFDGVLGGLLEVWNNGLILVTSDHGNMEDLSTRKHTDADVPALVIGDKEARAKFTRDMKDLTDIAPAIWKAVMQD
jgi:bisphosphoglycerate-independent phosphoglycerate mutase (AlkP superfamily)